jgi:hypothetical protein
LFHARSNIRCGNRVEWLSTPWHGVGVGQGDEVIEVTSICSSVPSEAQLCAYKEGGFSIVAMIRSQYLAPAQSVPTE